LIAGAGPIRLRLSLRDGSGAPEWPDGFTVGVFAESDGDAVERLLTDARADGLAGCPTAVAGWYDRVSVDPKWDPDLVTLARHRPTGRIVGVVHGWRGAFVKDLAVEVKARRLGLGAVLLHETARHFRARSACFMDLKVRAENMPARRFYERLGFVAVPD